MLNIQPQLSSCNLLVTEPLLNFEYIQETMHEMVFENYNFNAFAHFPCQQFIHTLSKTTYPSLSPLHTGIIVDTGFSSTTVR